MNRKDGYQRKTVGDQGREPVENFLVSQRGNNGEGRRLPRTLLARMEQYLQEFWIPLDTGKQEKKSARTWREEQFGKTATEWQERIKSRRFVYQEIQLAQKLSQVHKTILEPSLKISDTWNHQRNLNNWEETLIDCPNLTRLRRQRNKIPKMLEYTW